MAIFITSTYTVLIVTSNTEMKTQSNLLPPDFDVTSLTSAKISDRRQGSKIHVVIEQMQIAVIWSCKTCLLFLYHRLTETVSARLNVAIKLLAAYIALGFVVMAVLYFAAWCRPFTEYWAVPTESSQCNAMTNHRITNAVFNISSDLIMLCIALSLFLRSLLPLKRKLVLCGVFSFGIFAIIAAVLNKYYSFTRPYEPTWIFWYCRESSTAIVVANLPFTWTLLRKLFNLGAFDEEHPPPPTYHSSRTARGRRTARVHQSHHTAMSTGKRSTNQGTSESHSVSLLDSILAVHDGPSTKASENSDFDTNTIGEEPIRRHDFAARGLEEDLERGISGPRSCGASIQNPSPTTSAPGGMTERLYPDGTGGYVTYPRRAHLSPEQPSEASRPTSPTSTHYTSSTQNTTRHQPTASSGGGGRSAADRRKRTRTSV
jgi:hypothetical protein